MMLEMQSAAGNQCNFKNGTADTRSELNQEEIFQLNREGISYYDSRPNVSVLLNPI